MRRPRVQFTLSRLMAVVALAGLCAAAARVHAGLGAFAVGCSALGLARTCTAIDRRRATGRPVGSVRAVMVLLDSLGVGAVILALSAAGSCFAAVCGYVLILRFAPSREGSPLGVTVVGTTGLLGAAATWALSRRHFWPYRYWRD